MAQSQFTFLKAVIPKRGILQPREGSPINTIRGRSFVRLKNGCTQDDPIYRPKIQIEPLPEFVSLPDVLACDIVPASGWPTRRNNR